MRSRALPWILLALVTAGLIFSLLYYRNQSPDGAPMASASTAPSGTVSPDASTPSGSPQPDGSASPAASASVAAQPSGPAKATNPNPDLTVDANGLSRATAYITSTKGAIRFKFYPKDAPNTTKRIIELINQGFYNGLAFHRVVPGFVVQGGDPQGTGMGGSGQKLKAEFNERKHAEGAVAMARASDPDSADSQFYITLAPQPQLDRSYTVFGLVVEGMDVVKSLQVGDKMTSVIIE